MGRSVPPSSTCNGDCKPTSDKRPFNCPKCRLKKCIEAGMKITREILICFCCFLFFVFCLLVLFCWFFFAIRNYQKFVVCAYCGAKMSDFDKYRKKCLSLVDATTVNEILSQTLNDILQPSTYLGSLSKSENIIFITFKSHFDICN